MKDLPPLHFIVTVVVAMLCATATGQGKATIGIVELENKAEINPVTVHVITDMLMTAFTKSGKFEVVERDAVDRILDEQNFAASGAVSAESGARMGQIAGADYMVIGSVTEAGFNAKSTAAYGIVTTQSSVTLAIDIRVVDSSTGIAKLAETFREVRRGISLHTNNSGSVNFAEGPGGEMARDLVNNITAKVLVAVYVPKVVKADPENNDVIVNYGDQLMKPGDIWNVYRVGEELLDPDTGESLGASESRTGSIRITEATGKMSHAEILEGDIGVGDVCRQEQRAPQHSQPQRTKVDPF